MQRWIYRRFLWGLRVLTAALLGVYIFLLSPRSLSHPLTIFILALPLILWGAAYLAAHRALFRAAATAFDQDCDPTLLAELSVEWLAGFDRRGKSRDAGALLHHLNLSTALSAQGDGAAALAQLDLIAPRLPGKSHRVHLAYAINRAAVCAQLGQTEELLLHLRRGEELLAAQVSAPGQPGDLRLALDAGRCAYRFLTEGTSPGLESAYRALLSRADTPRLQATLHLTLGKCALARDDRAPRRPSTWSLRSSAATSCPSARWRRACLQTAASPRQTPCPRPHRPTLLDKERLHEPTPFPSGFRP